MTKNIKVSDSDIKNLLEHMPHMHVLAQNNEMSRGVMTNASQEFVKALSSVAKMVKDPAMLGGGIDDKAAQALVKVLRGNTTLERKTTRLRKDSKGMETGGSFGSVMGSIGKEALKLAPTLVPIALSLL